MKDNSKRCRQTNKTPIEIKPIKSIIYLSVFFRKVKAKAIGVNNNIAFGIGD